MNPTALVLNGPNLNLLGERDPGVYGSATLSDIEAGCAETASALGLDVRFRQSNHEGELIDTVQQARHDTVGVIANLGAFTHTSLALMDALAVLSQPLIEVHLSNVHARESVRRHSYVSQVADAVIAGAGPHGYELALRHLVRLLEGRPR